ERAPRGPPPPATLRGPAPGARPPRRRAAARPRRGPGPRPRDRRPGGALDRVGARTLAARARAPDRRLREAPCTPYARSATLPEPAHVGQVPRGGRGRRGLWPPRSPHAAVSLA